MSGNSTQPFAFIVRNVSTTAKAEAEAMGLKNKAVTPEIIQLEAAQKWNGKLPRIMAGNAVPFLSLNGYMKR